MPRPRTLAALVVALFTISAAPASASLTNSCDDPASAPVFAPWSDQASYFLAPDGGFENGADGWSLDGASVAAGNESFALSGPGSSSLSLPSGSSATSPSVCVAIEHPTFRYVFRKTSGSPLASLRVSAVLPGGVAVPVGTVVGSSAWSPSPVTLIGANLVSDTVAFRFTPNSGNWQVDDVYVDPRGSH
jgi:hypothetical protein